MAKKLIPLIKVDGTENCSDLLTKHLASATQQKHVAYMQLEFREGRAAKAAQLHLVQRLEPQGEFREEAASDRWEERGEQGRWVRYHRTPRVAMFTPFRVPNGPGRKTRLNTVRETIGIDEVGCRFKLTDDWTRKADAHRVLPARWTGITVFRTSEHDDKDFGEDQRRQRERARGQVRAAATASTRLSWADLSDGPGQ